MTDTIRFGHESQHGAASMAGGYPDMVVDPQEPIDPSTVMADLRETLSTGVEVEDLHLPVPSRPNIKMVFRPVIDFDQLKMWTKRSKETNRKDSPVDQKKLSAFILVETCVGMQYKPPGREQFIDMVGSDGRAMTFKHRETQDMLGAVMGGHFHAVDKMYGNDGHIMIVAKTVMETAGYVDFDLESGIEDPLGS